MNRVVALAGGALLLAVVAVAMVLFSKDPEIQVDPVVGGNGDEPEAEEVQGDPVRAGNPPGRVAAPPVEEIALDPMALVGLVVDEKGNGLEFARVASTRRQLGGEQFGMTWQSVQLVGEPVSPNGSFRIHLAGGGGTYVAAAPGYAPLRKTGLTVGQRVVFRLQPLVEQRGQVLDPEGGPAAGGTLRFFDPRGTTDGLPVDAVVRADGTFSAALPGPGQYSVRVRSAAGIELERSGIEVSRDPPALVLQLNGRLALKAQVTDRGGRPVAGALLQVQRFGERGQGLSVASHADGSLKAFGLGAGDWTGFLSKEGFADLAVDFGVGAETLEMQWSMVRNSSVRVRVSDAAGHALAGTEVNLLAETPLLKRGLQPDRVHADSEGVAVFPQVPPGRYILSPEQIPGPRVHILFESAEPGQRGKGTLAFSQLVQVEEGREAEFDLVLVRHLVLTVHVVRDGEPVVGARGFLHRGSGPRRKTHEALDLSDIQGDLRFPATWMGEYILEVQGGPNEFPAFRNYEMSAGYPERTLSLPSGSLRGRLLLGDHGASSVELSMRRMKDSDWREVGISEDDGSLLVSGLGKGNYYLRVSGERFAEWESEQLNFASSASHLELGEVHLQPAAVLEGVVQNLPAPQGGLFGSLVVVLDRNGVTQASLPLSGDGAFRVTGLEPGPFVVKVYANGAEVLSLAVDAVAGGKALELRVPD